MSADTPFYTNLQYRTTCFRINNEKSFVKQIKSIRRTMTIDDDQENDNEIIWITDESETLLPSSPFQCDYHQPQSRVDSVTSTTYSNMSESSLSQNFHGNNSSKAYVDASLTGHVLQDDKRSVPTSNLAMGGLPIWNVEEENLFSAQEKSPSLSNHCKKTRHQDDYEIDCDWQFDLESSSFCSLSSFDDLENLVVAQQNEVTADTLHDETDNGTGLSNLTQTLNNLSLEEREKVRLAVYVSVRYT
jgi:hypothetical protein